MDLKQLDYFVDVADASSFSKAAQLLSVAQPALSHQIRALEVELRQALFLRNGRGVTLTPPGARLLAHARGILQQVEREARRAADRASAAAQRYGGGDLRAAPARAHGAGDDRAAAVDRGPPLQQG